MTDEVGPRADVPLAEIDPNQTVVIEIIGEDAESGYTVIHDRDYLEPTGQYLEMTLEQAIEIADEFCCDCFTRANLDFSKENSQ